MWSCMWLLKQAGNREMHGPESQHTQLPVMMTPRERLSQWLSKLATDQHGTLIKGGLGQ